MNNDQFSAPEEEFLGISHPTPEQEAAAKKRAEEEREVRRVFLTQLMDNHMFRDWLYGVLVDFGTFETAIGVSPTGFPDPMATMHKNGMKAAGWHLWCIFDDVAPERTSLMRRTGFKPQA